MRLLRQFGRALGAVVTATQLPGISHGLRHWREEQGEHAAWRAEHAKWRMHGIASGGQAGPPGEAERARRTYQYWRARMNPRPQLERARWCGVNPRVYSRTCRCGTVDDVPLMCGMAKLCPTCAARYAKRLRRKLVRGFTARTSEAQRAWRRQGSPAGREPWARLITLTVGHSGDLGRDRKLLSDAWHRFHAWYTKNHGQLVYAWVVEVTPGSDGTGHVHAHVCALMPFVRFQSLHEEWRRATRGCARVLDVRTVSPKRAANYVAKYASKGCAAMDAALAVSWWQASHKRRTVSASRGFWVPETECWHERIVKRNETRAGLNTCTVSGCRATHEGCQAPPPTTS